MLSTKEICNAERQISSISDRLAELIHENTSTSHMLLVQQRWCHKYFC